MKQEALLIDCMEYMRTIPDKYFDLAVCDPIYGSIQGGYTSMIYDGIEHKTRGRCAPDRAYNRAIWTQEKTPPEYFLELFRVSKNQVIWGGQLLCNVLA